MASRNYPFNTVENSRRAERLRRRRRARASVLSICTVIILLLLSLIILLIGIIVDVIGGLRPSQPNNPNETPTTDSQTETPVYVPISWESRKIHDGILVLVNDNHYFDPATVENLIKIKDNRTQIGAQNPYMLNMTYAIWMQKEAFDAMEIMMQKYFEISEDGSVMIKYAYRTLQDQSDLGSVVQAGYSDHHTGCCIALHDGNEEGFPALDGGHWIYANSYKFGFVQRYPTGKESYTGVSNYTHCFRYVGIPHATYMYTHDLCLEEYVQLLKTSYSTGNHLAISGADGNQYEVYYVPASDAELTSINVPKDYSYTISGDNDNGFIVTVNLSDSNA